MTDRSPSTRAARAGGLGLLARAAVLALLAGLVSPALAQTVTWEAMPGVRRLPTDPDRITALTFLRGEGPAAADPAADSLVVFSFNGGAFLYNPSGAAGAAGSNGEWGAWYPLCSGPGCNSFDGGLVTTAGTIVAGSQAGATAVARGTARGRTWQTYVHGENRAAPFVEPGLPGMAGPDGTPTILAGTTGFDGYTYRTDGDGAPGTWTGSGLAGGKVEAFGVVPPSPSMPDGRVLAAVWNGITYSDDGGLTYTLSSAFGQAAYIAYSFAFLPVAGHPYGGHVYAGIENVGLYPEARAEVHRSDDGGATWALARRFTAAELSLPVASGTDVSEVTLYATADGVLWAGVGQSTGASNPARTALVRSVDGGATWMAADAGYRNVQGWGYRVNEFAVSRTGVLYAATDRGVWRTTTAVVAEEAPPSKTPEVGLSVRPNPASGRVEVVVTLAEAGAVRVAVFDAQGREVAVAFDGALAAGERAVPVETGAWPAGVYIVRVSGGAGEASAQLIVAR